MNAAKPHQYQSHRLPAAATAFHEAGHAVAAVVRHVPFKHVSVCQIAGSAGHILLRSRAHSFARVHAEGVVAMAGEAAQRQFAPRSVRRHHGAGDQAEVAAFAFEWCGGSEDVAVALVRLWVEQARQLVASYSAPVERVAAELLRRDTLTSDEVMLLVRAGSWA